MTESLPPDALAEDAISAYLDDECSAAERVAVEARLASDTEWQQVYAEVRDARAAVRALPPREPPAGFIDAVCERVRVADDGTGAHSEPSEPAESSGRHARRTGRRAPRIVAGLAAAAAIAVGFLIATPRPADHTRVTPPIATLANSHAATTSLNSDPLSGLAPVVATPENRP
jgi:anti-sigma factor RsiW